MLRLATDAITSFSIAPLRVSAYFGFLFSGFALLSLLYILGSWLFFNAVPGWTSLMALDRHYRRRSVDCGRSHGAHLPDLSGS